MSSLEPLAHGAPAPIGRFHFDGTTWRWSEALFAIYGFEPGAVVPTTELMLSHLDATDVPESRASVKVAMAGGEPFASYQHLLDASGRRRTVVVVGQGRLDEHGEVAELHGFVVDLTRVVATDVRADIDRAVTGVTEHRAAIEQAKGMLMLALGVSSEEAFAVLTSYSQDRNVKLNALAEKLVGSAEEQQRYAEDPRTWVLQVLAGERD